MPVMDVTQSLQQSNSGLATGNPQSLLPSGLQNQSTTSLQPAGSQSFEGLSLLDGGGTPVALSSLPKTSSSIVQATPTPEHAKTILIYGGTAVIVIAVLAATVYGLLKER